MLNKIKFSNLLKCVKNNYFINSQINRTFCVKEEETKKEIPPLMTENDLKSDFLSIEPYNRLLDLIEEKENEHKKFKNDISILFKNRDSYNKLQKDLDNLKTVNNTNHQNTEKLKDLIKERDQEIEGIRVRLTKEIEKEKIFGISKFAKDILEVMDNLDRILKFNEKEKEKFPDFYLGIEMTLNSSLNILKRFEITKMNDVIGKKVNLNHHEITFNVPDPTKEDDEVIHVQTEGYLIKDRVLRAAKVGTVKNN